ncbi:hypothetical protein WOLCODRAFT_83871 [Wolfiporia cocos MD-104 SS10]|uniref:Retrotransposon gag domain-containing protein n=1 Tax=Wolfiporia cocos (strain MD-104) TaxID=742152 RepID=A0A2H3J5N9_WOLCO|nr:hypothetical protein WOLCODRAFT_83871 [Wolfiporia cocos MD-104 SS10]
MSATPAPAPAAAPASVRKEKVPPPPEFSGVDGKVQAKEWIEKLGLYFAKVKPADDEERITTALYRLSGEAYQFMGPLLEKAGNGEPLGTWADFKKQILNQYAKKTDKEIAEREIKAFYGSNGKKKVEANFFTYCSKFRTLGRLSEIDGTTLLREFKEVLPEKGIMPQFLVTVTPAAIPADWDKYVDLCLELYKIAYPDKLDGSIFKEEKKEEKKEKKDQPKETAPKKVHSTGKGKATSTSANKKPAENTDQVCSYCKQKGHFF